MALSKEPKLRGDAPVRLSHTPEIPRLTQGLISRNTFFVGAPYTIAVVQIPQRFQAVNMQSPLNAGLRLLPLTVSSPTGSFVASLVGRKNLIPPNAMLLTGAALQMIGAGLLLTITDSTSIQTPQYGFQVLLGFGFGTSITTMLMIVPMNAELQDRCKYAVLQWLCYRSANLTVAIAVAAITQFRTLGGALGLAIVNSVFTGFLRSSLLSYIATDTINAVLESIALIDSLPSSIQSTVRHLFAHGYALQSEIMLGFVVAQFLATLLFWKPKTVGGR